MRKLRKLVKKSSTSNVGSQKSMITTNCNRFLLFILPFHFYFFHCIVIHRNFPNAVGLTIELQWVTLSWSSDLQSCEYWGRLNQSKREKYTKFHVMIRHIHQQCWNISKFKIINIETETNSMYFLFEIYSRDWTSSSRSWQCENMKSHRKYNTNQIIVNG